MRKTAGRPENTLPDGRPAVGPGGIDVTLIRWMLSLTPGERLRMLEQNLRALEKLRACRIRD